MDTSWTLTIIWNLFGPNIVYFHWFGFLCFFFHLMLDLSERREKSFGFFCPMHWCIFVLQIIMGAAIPLKGTKLKYTFSLFRTLCSTSFFYFVWINHSANALLRQKYTNVHCLIVGPSCVMAPSSSLLSLSQWLTNQVTVVSLLTLHLLVFFGKHKRNRNI